MEQIDHFCRTIIVGMVIGTFVSKKIEAKRLQKAFGWFVLIMGIFIVGKELL